MAHRYVMIGAEQSNRSAGEERAGTRPEPPTDFLAVVRGPQLIFEFANAAYIRLIGDRPCLGRRFRDVLPEAIEDGVAERLAEVYRSGVPYRARNFHSSLRGRGPDEIFDRLVTFQFKPLRDLDGGVSGVYIEGNDAAEQAGDEAALESLQVETHRQWAELESIYESAPVGLALLGAERFEYRRLNTRQAEILGLPAHAILGQTVRQTSPAVADASETLLRQVVAGGQVRDVEIEGELPQQPGVKRAWLVSYSPIYVKDTVDSIICTALETTELKAVQRALVQNEKLAAVGRLAGSIAHEINNPLEAITNLLYLARHSRTLSEAQGFLDTADGELRRVAAITSQTLRFHRQATDPQLMTCVDLIGAALSLNEGRLGNLNVAVLKRKRAHQPVICFEGEIRQVLNNIMGNAIDAMSPGGGRLFLRSREGKHWRTGRSGLWITVGDTGSGMSPEALRRAFEPFFTTKGMHGTGLGLWISNEIVQRHGGCLLVRSSQRPGQSGTVFSLFLPFNAVRR